MAKKSKAVEAPMVEEIHSIKGFDLDWKCRDSQFEIGKTYEHEGDVSACKAGFHAIEGYPLEVFDYYAPGLSRYAEVTQSGAISRHSCDSKVASAKITIGVELHIHDLVQRAVKWVFDRAKPEGDGSHATGWQGAASATGERGAASATGERGAASATGWQGAASATGQRGAASATGERGAASATGQRGAASATGTQGAASAPGWRGAASATGWRGAASATGTQGAASATGWRGKVMGKTGNALFLVYRDDDYNIVHAWAGIVGRDGIKEGVWYLLNADGKPEETS